MALILRGLICLVLLGISYGQGSDVCPSFSVSNTEYDTVNYATCMVYACPGANLVLSGCNANCVGDQYFILFDQQGTQVAVNDDGGGAGCGLCAEISFSTTQSCQVYNLDEGCYSDTSCGGEVTVSGGSVTTSLAPTSAPYTFDCPVYSTSDSNSDMQNYGTCEVYACPGAALTLSGCNTNCVGDQYLRLYSAAGDEVGAQFGSHDNFISCTVRFEISHRCFR